MKTDVIEKYKKLKQNLEELHDDIKFTEKVMDDPKVGWYIKHEYQNDISEDRRQIMQINEQISLLMDFMYQNKMFDEISEVNRLNEEEKKKKLAIK